jgi:hypothetical protein
LRKETWSIPIRRRPISHSSPPAEASATTRSTILPTVAQSTRIARRPSSAHRGRARRTCPYYHSSGDGGRTWSREVQLSDFVPGYDFELAEGYLEPYGDYFELDVDGAGETHALWGEGPIYAGPGTVWYARER